MIGSMAAIFEFENLLPGATEKSLMEDAKKIEIEIVPLCF